MHFPTAENGDHYGGTKGETTVSLAKRMGGWGRVRERRIIQLVGEFSIPPLPNTIPTSLSGQKQVLIDNTWAYHVPPRLFGYIVPDDEA